MNCAEFRSSYEQWRDIGPSGNPYPAEHEDWFRHQQDCHECQAWARRAYCRSRGIQPDQHCCLDMASAIAHPVEAIGQGPNRVLDWYAPWNEYRIPMPYDGYASTLIHHCPWCGDRLPDSNRERWYNRLWSLGYDDPGCQDIPDEFNTDEWWRAKPGESGP